MAKKSPEVTLSPEQEISDIEAAPFQEQENKALEGITNRYVEATKIDSKSIKAVDGILARDTEEAYQDFALEWFKNNEEQIRQEGRIIPPGVSDEWKISMVLSS